jgi:hypothetical protein
MTKQKKRPKKILNKKELIYLKDKENFEEFLKGFKYLGYKNNNNYNNNYNIITNKNSDKFFSQKPIINKRQNLSFNF